jgi:hypothetical protein
MADTARKLHILTHEAEDMPGTWVGVCLDYDIVSQGGSEKEALAAVLEAVAMVAKDCVVRRPSARIEEYGYSDAESWNRWMMAFLREQQANSRSRADSASDHLASKAGELLRAASGVDAAFLGRDSQTIYVVAEQHSSVDGADLVDVEDALSVRFGRVEVTLRAHQGRDPEAMFPGLRRLL